jgi:16S rRNA processing protein RimM
MTLQYPYPADRYMLVGSVTRSHGLKGELKIAPHFRPPEYFKNYSRAALVAVDGRMTELLEITGCRIQKNRVILKLDTIDTKDEADLTIEMGVLVDIEEAGADERTVAHPLQGLAVWTVDNIFIGEVEAIGGSGAQELLIVKDGAQEYLIPLVKEIVVSADERRLVIDPPDGLLELNRDQKS